MSDHRSLDRSRTRGRLRGWFGRGRTRALLCLACVGSLAFVTSTAYWTDQAQVSGTTFSTGTLDIKVNDVDNFTGATVLSMATMVPGNTSAQVLTIKNGGTAPFRYVLQGGLTGTNASNFSSSATLTLLILLGGTKTGTGNASTCTGGSQVYSGALTATVTTTLLTSRPAATLTANQTEALCFQVSFSSTADTGLQGMTANATFTATASQVP